MSLIPFARCISHSLVNYPPAASESSLHLIASVFVQAGVHSLLRATKITASVVAALVPGQSDALGGLIAPPSRRVVQTPIMPARNAPRRASAPPGAASSLSPPTTSRQATQRWATDRLLCSCPLPSSLVSCLPPYLINRVLTRTAHTFTPAFSAIHILVRLNMASHHSRGPAHLPECGLQDSVHPAERQCHPGWVRVLHHILQLPARYQGESRFLGVLRERKY